MVPPRVLSNIHEGGSKFVLDVLVLLSMYASRVEVAEGHVFAGLVVPFIFLDSICDGVTSVFVYLLERV
jgi:hypothetical protein